MLVRALAWAAAAATATAIVKGTRIGPVVLTVSARHGWGVHVGDALALLPLAVAAAYTRTRAGRLRRRRPTAQS